jgi:hypothetical protein
VEPTRTPVAPVAMEELSTVHPRLFFDANRLPLLREQAQTTHRAIWEPINEFADALLAMPPPAQPPEDDDLETYRNSGNLLIALAFACVIGERDDHCTLAVDYLLAYAGWTRWSQNEADSLGAAHMISGSALAYDWLYDRMTPEQRATVRTSLAGWAEEMYRASAGPPQDAWDNWWRKSYIQNHYWSKNSSLGLAGLALLGDHERAPAWLEQATAQLTIIHDMLEQIADGSWHESIHYQNYALIMTFPFWENLRRIKGVDLFPHTYLRNYAAWHVYNHIPERTEFILSYGNFDLDWTIHELPALLRFVAREYQDGYAEWVARQVFVADPRAPEVWAAPWYAYEFLYYDPTVPAQAPNDLPLARTFPDLEGVIWRTGWGAEDLIFGLKTGPYGGRFNFDSFIQGAPPWELPCAASGCEFNTDHNHDDTNTFYLYRGGSWLAPESQGYDAFDTALHNTLLIDGAGQYRPPFESNPADYVGSDGALTAVANLPHFDYLASDATGRYRTSGELRDVTRHVLFVRPGYFVMLDNLAADTPHTYEWISHIGQSALREGAWVRADAGDGQVLGIGVVAPAAFEVVTGEDRRPYVRIAPATPQADVRLINVLYPTTSAEWSARPELTLLADSGSAVAVRIAAQSAERRSDDVLIAYDPTGAEAAVGPYRFDGRVAVVALNADATLERLFVFGGTTLRDQSGARTLVEGLDPQQPFEALYAGRTLSICGAVSDAVQIYAPGVERIMLNGFDAPVTRSGDYVRLTATPATTGVAEVPPTCGRIPLRSAG